MKPKKIIFRVVIFSLVFIPLLAQNYGNTEIISIAKDLGVEKKLRSLRLDFLMEWNDRVYIILSQNDLYNLEKENIIYNLETHNFFTSENKGISTQGGVNGQFHSYLELEQELLAIQDAYPDIARVYDIGDSWENRNIYALKISDHVNLDEQEAEVLFLGCHHAREWISVEVPYLLGKYLVENYASDPEIKRLVDQSEIWIVPLVNPDGLEYSIYFYRYWRKNRRDNQDGTYGVDPNRNYGYKWGHDDIGSSPDTSSPVYRGPSPFSEPETHTIREFCFEKNFQILISYHNYSQIIIYPWGYTYEPSEKDNLLHRLAAKMSELMEPINGTVYEYGQGGNKLYVTNGDATDWGLGIVDIPSFTVELPPKNQLTGGFFNAEEDIQPIFDENLPAMLYAIDWAIQSFGLNYQIPDWKQSILKEIQRRRWEIEDRINIR